MPQPMSDDAAASSLSAKIPAYEPSGSTFENTTVNKSSRVQGLLKQPNAGREFEALIRNSIRSPAGRKPWSTINRRTEVRSTEEGAEKNGLAEEKMEETCGFLRQRLKVGEEQPRL